MPRGAISHLVTSRLTRVNASNPARLTKVNFEGVTSGVFVGVRLLEIYRSNFEKIKSKKFTEHVDQWRKTTVRC